MTITKTLATDGDPPRRLTTTTRKENHSLDDPGSGRGGQRFRCEPLRCTLSEQSCAARHLRAKAGRLWSDIGTCGQCKDGAHRAKKLGVVRKRDDHGFHLVIVQARSEKARAEKLSQPLARGLS